MKILAALLVIALAGCGGSAVTSPERTAPRSEANRSRGETKKQPPSSPEIAVSLDGYMGPENVGLLMAQKRGYFEDAGLEVSLGKPVLPRRPVTYVANRTDDLGLAQLPQVAVARERGAPIVAVGSVIPRPTAAMIWLKGSGINSVADLKGKVIAIPGVPFQKDLLRYVLSRAGLGPEDVEVKQLGYNTVSALLHGRADAIFGGSSNLEGIELEANGVRPEIKPVSRFGVPAYDELMVIARTDMAARHPRLIRAFIAAVARGTAAAAREPGPAARVIEESLEENPDTTHRELAAQLAATLPLLSRTSSMDPSRAADFIGWMKGQGWVRGPIRLHELLTSRYLPQS